MVLSQTIDGIDLDKLIFVRVVDHDLPQSATLELISPWEGKNTLGSLAEWVRRDGHDTGKIHPHFRNTIHGSLNHHVAGHALGNWSQSANVIVAPLKGMVSANGAPHGLNTVDTWWALGPGDTLKIPNATVVRPDKKDLLRPEEFFRAEGTEIFYTTNFNNEREKAILAQTDLNLFIKKVAGRIHAQYPDSDTNKLQKLISDTLDQPRSSRMSTVAKAIDIELKHRAKLLAVNAAIQNAGGPIKPGGMWAWADSLKVTEDTNNVAAALGTRADSHTGGPEDIAIELIEAGNAHAVTTLSDVSPQTRKLAQSLLENKAYQAYEHARAVDDELAHGLRSGMYSENFQLSSGALERLAVMIERAKLKELPLYIEYNDHARNEHERWAPTILKPGEQISEDRLEEALRSNIKLIRVIEQAQKQEHTNPNLTQRLDHCLQTIKSSTYELGRIAWRFNPAIAMDYKSIIGPPPPPPSPEISKVRARIPSL